MAQDDSECLAMIRELLSFLPSNNVDDPPRRVSTDPTDRADAELDSIVPLDPSHPYDIKEVIGHIVDDGYFSRSTNTSPATS